MHSIDMEGQCLEERDGILTAHLLEHDSELVVRDLIDEVSLELNNDVVSGENGAECVALLSEETEAVAFADEWVIEAGFDTRLR